MKSITKIEITEQMFKAVVTLHTECYTVDEKELYNEYYYYVNYMRVSKRDNHLLGGVATYYMQDMNA